MTDEEFERNLDTQNRRLAAMDAAVSKALSEHPRPADLPTTAATQSYDELSRFNDELRTRSRWDTIDLDAALTPAQAAALTTWRNRQRIPWSTTDIAMVGLAGLLGTCCVWFDAAVDRSVRSRLNALAQTPMLRGWEKHGKRLPIDYMGPGFGGRAHRVMSAGHDLARPFEALRQIMDGEFRGVRWSFGQRSTVTHRGQFDTVTSFEEALARWIMHLSADILTPMSLPIPGSSRLTEMDNQAIRKFAKHAYSGLRAGEGLNIRSATIPPTLTVLTTEITIRTYTHLASYQENGTAKLTERRRRNRTELLLAAHGLVGAASLGKATAKGFLVPKPRRHPSAVRHVHLPTLIRGGQAALEVVADAKAARESSAASWDDLLLATAQPWQLDIANDVEERWLSTHG